MSDAADPREPEADAWATACEEDLAAEKARRREEYGQPPLSAAEELRRLADAVSDRVAELGRPFGGTVASAAAQGAAQQLIAQARAAIEPVVERNPGVFDHIAAAGGELLAAYRAAVQNAEGRWTAGAGGAAPQTGDPAGERGEPDGTGPAITAAGPDAGGPAGVERIDLDKGPSDSAGPGPDAGGGTSGDRGTSGRSGTSASGGTHADAETAGAGEGQDGAGTQDRGPAGSPERPGPAGPESGGGPGDDG
jgi:hypothetical protein